MNLNVNIVIIPPHLRFVVGWQYLEPDEENDIDYYTFELFLFIISIQCDWS